MDKLWEYQIKLQPVINEISPLPTQQASSEPPATKRFKWSTSLDNQKEFKAETAIPISDLKQVKITKDSLTSIHRSASGAQGVYFVVTKQGTTVLKPPAHSLASEIVASLIGLSFGLKTPKFLLIKNATEEGVQVLESLKKVDPTWSVVARLFDQAFLIHKEFIKGCSIGEARYEKINVLFDNSEGTVKLTEKGEELFRQLGLLLALDVFLNNSDRMPLIWNNQGNSGNVFLEIRSGGISIVNLDAQVRSIDKDAYPAEHKAYFESVNEFLRSLAAIKSLDDIKSEADTKIKLREFHNVVSLLAMWMHVELPRVETVKTLVQGFTAGLQLFKPGSKSNDRIQEAIAVSFGYMELLDKNQVLTGLKGINRDFLEDMTRVFQQYSSKVNIL